MTTPGESRDCSISLVRANVIVVAFSLPAAVSLYLLFLFLAPRSSSAPTPVSPGNAVLFGFLLIAGILLHELLHAAGWIVFGRQARRRVQFGFKLNTLTPYAHLQSSIPAGAYRMGVLLPLLMLGLPPYILGIFLAQRLITVYGLFFILAAGGDLLVLWLLRGVPAEALVQDHPTRAGCLVEDQG